MKLRAYTTPDSEVSHSIAGPFCNMQAMH